MNLSNYIIDDRIFSTKFSCNLNKCKGACCTIKGTVGAPLLESEAAEVNAAYLSAKKYLSEENISIIEKEGAVVKIDGEPSVNTVHDNDCVFSYYEGEIAKCAIQKAYNNGEIKFRKPVSCFLYPIRISGKKRNIIKYDRMYECDTALDNGIEQNITIFEFVKDALISEYGEIFYNELKEKFLSN